MHHGTSSTQSRAVQTSRDESSSSAGFRRKAATRGGDPDAATLQWVASAAAGGDRDAMMQLYLRYKDHVYGYVCSIVRDEHEAEDVTQQVFTKLMLVIDRYELRAHVSFTAWLLRIARNVAIDHLRARRESLPAEAGDQMAAPNCDPAPTGLHDALDQLPPEQRSVILLRHVVGLTPGEIAQRMGKTESSVHGLHHRGRHALRRELTLMGMAPSCRPLVKAA